MLAIPPDLVRLYESLLVRKGVAVEQRPYFHKWLRFYLDFCRKYSLLPSDRQSVRAFDEKLRSKNQSETQRQQARQVVAVYFQTLIPADAPVAERNPAPTAFASDGSRGCLTEEPLPVGTGRGTNADVVTASSTKLSV